MNWIVVVGPAGHDGVVAALQRRSSRTGRA